MLAGNAQCGRGQLAPHRYGAPISLPPARLLCPGSLFTLGFPSTVSKSRGLHFPARSAATRRSVAAADAAAPPAPPYEAPEVLSDRDYTEAGISVTVTKVQGEYQVAVTASSPRPNLVLHWAVNEWVPPPESVWPAGTAAAGDKAVRTPFAPSNAVHVSFPEDACPSRLVFVLNDGDEWLNSGAGDFVVQLKPPSMGDLVEAVVEAEARYERWSLYSRCVMVVQVLDAAVAAGPTGMALVFTWLRLSTLRLLDWYRGTNYQSKDAAHAMKTLAQRMMDTARLAPDPLSRLFARMALAGLPRGGGNGDDIRHGILNVMREGGIREGHRPGIEDQFLESWHQKLHTNTTPEDVTICEAYLAFLHSGNMEDFWRVAWEGGRVTAETLASMDHPVSPTPCHLPHLIGPMQHYLWILKRTHSGADLDTAFDMARSQLDGDLAWTIGDILGHRSEWWVPGKIVDARSRLATYWRSGNVSRDVLMLDIALDAYFRLCVERVDKGSLGQDDLFNMVQMVLDNAAVTADGLEELTACAELWRRVGADSRGRWSGPEWGALALAAADNVSLCLGAHADRLAGLVQPHAERLGSECSIESAFILNFSEEVVRSQPEFILSPLLRYLGPSLRDAASVGAWQVVSQGEGGQPAAGRVTSMPDLSGIQGAVLAEPTIILAAGLTGNEDIPEGVVAVLTVGATDVLSHVAIRARAQGVLLATCFDPAQLEAMAAMEGIWAEAGQSPEGDVLLAAAEAPAAGSAAAGPGGAAAPKLKLVKPASAGKAGAWVLSEAQFAAGAVGGKGLNLAALRGKLPAWIDMPSSIALPFGSFERVLKDPANKAVASQIAAMEAQAAAAAAGAGVPPSLSALRRIIRSELQAPAALVAEGAAAAEAAGLIAPGAWAAADSPGWAAAWAAVCRVWASKYNDRAWLSRRTQGVPDGDLFMSVLLQQVVPAQYAFVLHTADPLTGERGKLHGEMVVGMGEALVGNFPGRALSFTVDAGSGGVDLLAMPSKREALLAEEEEGGAPLLIARSDSNGEDLEGFAGAGLYSSVPLVPLRLASVRYADEPLLWDAEARAALLTKLAEVGAAVEAACGGPQDVEGVVTAAGNVAVVQARPQVVK